jgi:hypothetical protein
MKLKIILTALALWASPVFAQQQCVQYEPFRDSLISQGVGLVAEAQTIAPDGTPARIEIWRAPDNTWAMIGIINDQLACVLQSGTDYSELPTF